MSKAVLMSIKPLWCRLIKSGAKTVEIRKTKPNLKPPFKVYIYETQGEYTRLSSLMYAHEGSRKVIGEFVCDWIRGEPEVAEGLVDVCLPLTSCVDAAEIIKYANGKMIYSWHISNLVIYDQSKELSEFKQCHKCPYGDYGNCLEHEYSCNGEYSVRISPQSWCYVEGEHVNV